MFEVLALSFAFVAGIGVKRVGLPPLVGFLAAGFVLEALGDRLGLPAYSDEALEHIAHTGVLVLLFTVGLKLKIGQLLKPHVIGAGLIHFAGTVALFCLGLRFIGGLGWEAAVLLAVALSFSSTVLAAKALEGKRELSAFHGRAAIGILIVQDIVALVAIAVFADQTPSVWALGLLGLPLIRPALYWLLDCCGQDEVLILLGMVFAVVIGGYGFETLGISGEIGALVMGVLLGGHSRSKDVASALWSLKEILLVGFFLQIGMRGLPDLADVAFAGAFLVLLGVKAALFFCLFTGFRLRARNAYLAALSLASYSEFGLIVAAALLPEWLVPLAVTVALSFALAAPLNRFAHPLYARFGAVMERFERSERHPDEKPANFGDASVVIMGLGRTGCAAYDRLEETGIRVLGMDADPYRVAAQREAGRNAVYGDVEDANFWHGVDLTGVASIVIAVGDMEAKVAAVHELRRKGFAGAIVAHAMHEEEVERIREAGADLTYMTMQQAGLALGNHALDYLADQDC